MMAYDPMGWLTEIRHTGGRRGAGVRIWAYDPAGNLLSQDLTQVGVRTVTNWSYDLADQLQTQTEGEFNACGTATFNYAWEEGRFDDYNRFPCGQWTPLKDPAWTFSVLST